MTRHDVAGRHRRPEALPRRRTWLSWVGVIAVGALIGGGAAVAPQLAERVAGTTFEVSAAAPSTEANGLAVAPPSEGPSSGVPRAGAPPSETPRVDPSASASPTGVADSGVLQQPGPVPADGKGTFRYAAGTGAVLGVSGPVRRFRVAVERGSGEDPEAFAALVDQTLGDERSWVGDGDGGVRLRRVAGDADHDFTVYLATRATAGAMCRSGGIDIRIGGVPYTSCRVARRVIINLDRWRLSAKPFLSSGVPLATYRQYVINHEVGHELGHGHEGCPKPGRPAPVMLQQTLRLDGCVPFAWPRRGGKRYAGPAV